MTHDKKAKRHFMKDSTQIKDLIIAEYFGCKSMCISWLTTRSDYKKKLLEEIY